MSWLFVDSLSRPVDHSVVSESFGIAGVRPAHIGQCQPIVVPGDIAAIESKRIIQDCGNSSI